MLYNKYLSFTMRQLEKKDIKPGLSLVFMNSAYFLNNSLENLVKNLGKNELYHLSQNFNANVLDLFKKIEIIPFGYWVNFEKIKEGLSITDKLYNLLNNHEISDENFEHVLKVWEAFKMKTKKAYHDLYLKLMFYYWLVCLKMNTAHYLSTGSYREAMVRFTDFNLKLISDIKKY